MSRIFLVFDPGTDLFTARQVVAERMTQAHALPNVSKPPQILQPLSSTNRALMVGVTSKTLTPIQMSVLARWTIIPRLLGVPGVANVSIWGERARQLQVQVDPQKLSDANVSLQQVIDTSGNALWVSPLTCLEASTPGTGGFIDTANQRLGIQHISPITTPESLGRVTLEGTKMTLGDVATVVEDHPPLIGDALAPTGPGLMFVIEKAPGASTLDVTRGTEAAIREMQPGLGGIAFNTTVFRPATYIEHGISNLEKSLIVAGILALLALVAFLLRWRAVVIILVTVPLAFVAAALVLDLTGATMNSIAFAGLFAASALVIDDAIVTMDSITSRLREDGAESTAGAITRASLDVRSASVYATLVVAVAIVPVYFLEQIPGAFFPEAATPYLLALLAALVVSVTVVPALAVLLLTRASVGSGESPVVRLLRRAYGTSLPRMISRPLPLLLAAGLVLVAGGVSARLDGYLDTADAQGESGPGALGCRAGHVPDRDGSPHGACCERVAVAAGRDTDRRPCRPGRDRRSDRRCQLGRVVGHDQPRRGLRQDALLDQERDERISRAREPRRGVLDREGQGEPHRHGRATPSTSGSTARNCRSSSAVPPSSPRRSPGSTASRAHASHGSPRSRRSRSRSISTPQTSTGSSPATSGAPRRHSSPERSVGSLFEKERVFDVVVWGTPQTRSNLTSVRNLLIETPSGKDVHLSQVADVRIAPSPPGDRAPGRLAPDRHQRHDERARPRRGHARHQPGPAVDADATRVSRRGAGRGHTADAAAHLARHRRRDRHAPAPAGLARQLALRGAMPGDSAGRGGGRPAGGAHRR